MVVLRALTLLIFIGAALLNAQTLRDALKQETGAVKLPAGLVVLHTEIVLPASAHDLDIDGAGATLQLAPDFSGRAALVIPGGRNVRIKGLTIDGNRDKIRHEVQDLPPSNVPFARFTRDNGILAEKTSGLRIEKITFHNIAGFPILVSASEKVRILSVNVTDSGSRNVRKRNNGTGGILLEEGTHDFEVTDCDLRNVLGNGIWTHSLYTSPRNADGRIASNHIAVIGRDAIQVGHATRVTVEKNTGVRIGYPVDAVDIEVEATPVVIDTAGNTDATQYRDNSFEEINGKCMDLDGFHDGEVRGNSCINNQAREAYPQGHYAIVMNNSNPDMQSRNILIWGNRVEGFLYGGLLVIGSGHRVSHNHFLRLNMAHCNEEAARYGCLYFPNEPDFLRSGIYLRAKAHRAADTRDNVIEDNEVNGYGIGVKCVVTGPGVSAAQNRIGNNVCTDDAPISARLFYLLAGGTMPFMRAYSTIWP
jgi:hypothetical protein